MANPLHGEWYYDFFFPITLYQLHNTINLKRIAHQICNFKLSNRVLGAEKSKIFDLHFSCNCCSFLGFRKQHLLYIFLILLSRYWYQNLAWKDRKGFGECRYKSIEKHHGYYIPKWAFHCCCSFYCRCEGEHLWLLIEAYSWTLQAIYPEFVLNNRKFIHTMHHMMWFLIEYECVWYCGSFCGCGLKKVVL